MRPGARIVSWALVLASMWSLDVTGAAPWAAVFIPLLMYGWGQAVSYAVTTKSPREWLQIWDEVPGEEFVVVYGRPYPIQLFQYITENAKDGNLIVLQMLEDGRIGFETLDSSQWSPRALIDALKFKRPAEQEQL